MIAANKSRIVRLVIFVFTLGLLFVSFVAYKHPVPSGAVKYITFDHEIRRLFTRAERENFRTGVTTEDVMMRPDPPWELAEAPPPPQVVAIYYRLSLIQQPLFEPNQLIFVLSPVLNL